MNDQQSQLPWEQPGWLDQVTTWIHARLAEVSWRATGPVEMVHQRPWSAFARVTTDHGLVFFKAPAPDSRYEAALTEELARWWPEGTVPLLGVDGEQGWLLSADAGDTLRSLTRGPDQIKHWLKLLPSYVELQLAMADRVPALLALGMPDRRLAGFPALYERLLDSPDALLIGQEGGLTPEEYQRLRALAPRVAALCEELARYGLPETLVHEEVHENNVLVREGRYTFTDWSDASVGHPFFSLLVTQRSIAHWLKLDEAGPEVMQVRDAYLEPWTRVEPRERLLQALDVAYRLAMINRALSWQAGLEHLAPAQKAEYADNVPGWLQDFLIAEAAGRE